MPNMNMPHLDWHEEKVRMQVEIERLQKENQVLRDNIKKIDNTPWTRDQAKDYEELRYKHTFIKEENDKLQMMFRTIAAVLKEYIDEVE